MKIYKAKNLRDVERITNLIATLLALAVVVVIVTWWCVAFLASVISVLSVSLLLIPTMLHCTALF